MRRVICLMLAFSAALTLLADPRPSRADITSQPEGASVIVDGQDRGLTPISLFDLKPGRHLLKYRLAGYVDRERYFDIAEGQVVQKSAVLDPEKGLLLVTSEPAGAAISVDGVANGQTPRLFTDLNAKDSYRIVLRKAGYREQPFVVKFNGRTPLVRHEALVLDSGTVTVASEPTGAFVTLNGVERGQTPVTVSGIPKGRASVRLRMNGFEDEVRELAINAGESQQLNVTMKGLPGTLTLTSVPAGARFYVNDEYRGKGETVLTGLIPGDYALRAELDGYGTMRKTISIANGETAREEFRLSNVKGRCEFRTSPAGVQIVVDGKSVGTTKATDRDSEYSDVFHLENILEGEHTVIFRKDGFAEKTIHPKVESSKTYQAAIKLRRVFKPNVEIVTDGGTYQGVLISNSPDFVTIEIKLGIQRSFPRLDIRKMKILTE